MDKNDYVWYASYGSNLSRDRFLIYIKGGRAEGSKIDQVGCIDQDLPLKDEPIIIPYELYFAESSKGWQDGGVAFIGYHKSKKKTLGRMYLIKKEQFFCVIKQENGGNVTDDIINNNLPKKAGKSKVFLSEKKYGRILHLGFKDGYPIYTFTTPKRIKKLTFNAPSKEYMNVIARGLREKHGLEKEQIIIYLTDRIKK